MDSRVRGFYKKILESFDMVVLNLPVGFMQFSFNTNPKAVYGFPVFIKYFHSLFIYTVVSFIASCLVPCAISPPCTVPQFVS